MKLATAHPAQPSAAEDDARAYLARDDGGLGAGACALLGNDARPDNYAALGRIIRAGIVALGEERARAEVLAMAQRRGRR